MAPDGSLVGPMNLAIRAVSVLKCSLPVTLIAVAPFAVEEAIQVLLIFFESLLIIYLLISHLFLHLYIHFRILTT